MQLNQQTVSGLYSENKAINDQAPHKFNPITTDLKFIKAFCLA